MGWLIAFVLLAISAGLFVAVRIKILSSKSLEILANIAGIVSLLAALAAMVISLSPPKSSTSSQPDISILSCGNIQLAASGDLNQLSEALAWDAGSSPDNRYELSAGTLSLTAGVYSWPLFPLITTRSPISGDFDAQIEINFKAEADHLDATAHMAGILVKPAGERMVKDDEHFPNLWIANGFSLSDAGLNIGCRGFFDQYSGSHAYLRIQRKNNIVRCAYSDNNQNWTWSEPSTGRSALPSNLDLAIFVFSTNGEPASARFSNLTVDCTEY